MSETRPGSESGGVAVSGATTNVRTSIPQVQVIHQPVHSPPYMPSFPYNQQQLMLQNAAVQGVYLAAAMQAGAMNQQLNIAAMQGRPPSASPKSPSVLSPSPTAGVTCVASVQSSASSTVSSSCANGKAGNNGSKGLVSQAGSSQGQATPHIGGKPVFSTQAVPSLLVGQIGVLPGQGPSGNPAFVSQSKNQSACHTVVSQPQLINSQSPLRMNSQSQLVTSGGQIFASQPMLTNPAMLQAMASLQQGIPLAAHQPLLATQSPTILAGQPLYIRTATPLQQQPSMVAAATAIPTGMQPVNSSKTAKLIDMTTGLQAKTVGVPTKTTNQGNKGLSTILPSTSKGSNTAKIHPTNISMQPNSGPKLNIPTITPKQTTKVRTKKSNPLSTGSQTKPSMPTSLSKPTTPTSQTNGATSLPKSQSDSEVETGRKTIAMMESTSEKKTLTESTSKQSTSEQKQEKRAQVDAPQPPTTTQETRQVESMDVSSGKSQHPAPNMLDNSVVVEKQKAIVKPHILTHVIEGFIIHEGPEPFPVQRSSLLTEYIPSKSSSNASTTNVEKESEQEETNGSSHDPDVPMADDTETRDGEAEGLLGPPNVDKRMSSGSGPKYVKRRKPTLKVRKTWRPSRVGRMSYNIPSRLPAEEHSSSHSSHESSSSPTSPAQPTDYDVGMDSSTSHPAKWTVQKVFDFIKSMPGCTAYAEEFRSQEIDGQALLLLKEDHLMTAMNMKLGPALKICARINSLKDNF
ncbi:polyhomeotic-like protein 2 isoform X2 [Octopus sinensis]|uniref:Polyhomeotic-like protein 2 isoform X2 n=1 Tax=Octopus sinensis TaxID=2607531 RepID=A0A6P7TII2_9MOLL|nr:polyhomeotic-like protein 2 isoform X2 [Octopus sinensis]